MISRVSYKSCRQIALVLEVPWCIAHSDRNWTIVNQKCLYLCTF